MEVGTTVVYMNSDLIVHACSGAECHAPVITVWPVIYYKYAAQIAEMII